LRKTVLQNPLQEIINILEEQRRRANKMLRREKSLHEKKKIEEIERNRSNTRKFFNESGSIKAVFKPQTRILSDELGNLITEEKDITNHFKKYFNQLLNQPFLKGRNETIFYYTTELKIKNSQQEKIDNIINKIKNNNALGETI